MQGFRCPVHSFLKGIHLICRQERSSSIRQDHVGGWAVLSVKNAIDYSCAFLGVGDAQIRERARGETEIPRIPTDTLPGGRTLVPRDSPTG